MITIREAAVITAYTNILLGRFEDFHKYAEDLLGRPIFTHEFVDPEVSAELKEKSKPEFLKISQTIQSPHKGEEL